MPYIEARPELSGRWERPLNPRDTVVIQRGRIFEGSKVEAVIGWSSICTVAIKEPSILIVGNASLPEDGLTPDSYSVRFQGAEEIVVTNTPATIELDRRSCTVKTEGAGIVEGTYHTNQAAVIYIAELPKGLRFLAGHIYKAPEEINYGKFVRLGSLLVVTADTSQNHGRFISEGGKGAGEREKFLDIAERLREAKSVRVDAGFCSISAKNKSITLSKNSFQLRVPVNARARELSVEFLKKHHPDYEVKSTGIN